MNETVVAEYVAAGAFDEEGDVGESLHADSVTAAIIASIAAKRRNCLDIAETVIAIPMHGLRACTFTDTS